LGLRMVRTHRGPVALRAVVIARNISSDATRPVLMTPGKRLSAPGAAPITSVGILEGYESGRRPPAFMRSVCENKA
jgi:hypothetical protein